MAEEDAREYRLQISWNNAKASYVYWLEYKAVDEKRENFWLPIHFAEGDQSWATRTANHYGIDVPEEPEI